MIPGQHSWISILQSFNRDSSTLRQPGLTQNHHHTAGAGCGCTSAPPATSDFPHQGRLRAARERRCECSIGSNGVAEAMAPAPKRLGDAAGQLLRLVLSVKLTRQQAARPSAASVLAFSNAVV